MLNLKKLLTKVLNQFEVSQAIIYASSNTHLIGNGIVRKIGKTAYLYIPALTGLTYAQDVELFTLPSGYRPVQEMQYDVVAAATSLSMIIRISVKPDGRVVAYNYSQNTGTANVRINCVYVVQ